MKVKFTLPEGYTRSFFDKNNLLHLARPMFDVEALKDDGNHIPDVPEHVTFGPELYNMLRRLLPTIAAREGENILYEGKVNSKLAKRPTSTYLYYGNTDQVDPRYAHLTLKPSSDPASWLNVVGYGNSPTIPAGVDAILAKKMTSLASPHGSTSRSQVLTNILNGVQDFSPLFSPLYRYEDPEYDPDNDPEEKGPRPTDHWVPRFDETGNRMFTKEGKPMWMPIPLVQDLPYYNFNADYWKHPDDTFDYDIEDPVAWKHWGTAPLYSDYTGKRAVTDAGLPKSFDYYLENNKLAKKNGYFPNISKKDARDAERFERWQQKQERGFTEVEKDAKARAKDRDAERSNIEEQKSKTIYGKNKTNNQADASSFRLALKHMFNEKPELFEERGFTKEDINKLAKYAGKDFNKFAAKPDEESKVIYILDSYKGDKSLDDEAQFNRDKDFNRWKDDNNVRDTGNVLSGNIIDAVKEPW